MNIIYVLLGISVVVAVIFFVAFIISVKMGNTMIRIHPQSECCLKMKLLNPKKNQKSPINNCFKSYGKRSVLLRQ